MAPPTWSVRSRAPPLPLLGIDDMAGAAGPGSLQRAREIARGLSNEERGLYSPGEGRTVLPGLILPQIDKEGPVQEVTLEQGDLLVHDPMCGLAFSSSSRGCAGGEWSECLAAQTG